ncbi:hypothetical protein CYMTET_53824, partial [Cymbomonas tetramitiformis]
MNDSLCGALSSLELEAMELKISAEGGKKPTGAERGANIQMNYTSNPNISVIGLGNTRQLASDNSPHFEITLDDAMIRQYVDMWVPDGRTTSGSVRRLPLCAGQDQLTGMVLCKTVDTGRSMEHSGIEVALVGQIEKFAEPSSSYTFLNE